MRIVQDVEDELRPRWVLWSIESTAMLVAGGVRIATAWDIAAVHRLLHGGWRADPARTWAMTHGLPLDAIPTEAPEDLFSQLVDDGDPDVPERATATSVRTG